MRRHVKGVPQYNDAHHQTQGAELIFLTIAVALATLRLQSMGNLFRNQYTDWVPALAHSNGLIVRLMTPAPSRINFITA